MGDTALRELGASRIVAASASALAVGPDLAGKEEERVLARRAAAGLALGAGIAVREVAWALGQPARSVRRLRDAPVPEALAVAVRMRLALEEVSGQRAPPLIAEPEVLW